jgi:hypothetical protein
MSRVTLMVAVLLCAGVAACGGEDECAPGAICTIAGNGQAGYGGDGADARNAALYLPIDQAVSPDGELWIIDFNNYRVRAVDDGGTIRTVLGSGELGDSPAQDGEATVPALEAALNHMTDLLFHGRYLYVAAWHNSRVKRLDLDTMLLEDYAGRGVRTSYDGDGGPALDAAFDLPVALAIDRDGDLLVMDQANQVIRAVDGEGVIRRVAGQCVVESESEGGCGDAPPLACPGSDKLICGLVDECAYPCTPSFAGDGGDALEMRMGQPFGQAVGPSGHMAHDADGGLLFADTNNHRIRRIAADGIVSTVAGTGERGFAGDGGDAHQAQLDSPTDLEVAEDGSIYIADTFNHCVRAIDPGGVITTVVGRCGEPGFSGDGGAATDATLKLPSGLELSGDRLYIADTGNHRVRAVVR